MKTVLVLGAGTGGIMTAARLVKDKNLEVTILDPAEYHYYQPAWTLVGADAYDYEKTKKKMADVMPAGVHWVKEYVAKIDPDHNTEHFH